MSAVRIPQFRAIVNSRCRRACFYCRPSGEAVSTEADVPLDLETLLKVAKAYVRLGGTDMKLTGGEPVLWKPLIESVWRLKNEVFVPHLQVISRDPRIGKLAPELAKAGIDLFNVSIDTLRPEIHYQITGVDDLPSILLATKQCVATGKPTKVNTVVMSGVNDSEVDQLITFCEETGVHSLKLLDVIKDLDEGPDSHAERLIGLGRHGLRSLYQPLASITQRLQARAIRNRWLFQGGLGHPMLSMQLPSGLEVIIKDSQKGAWYGSICDSCQYYPCHDALMALRLTADAKLQFCLLSEDTVINLATLGHNNGEQLEKAMRYAIEIYNSAKFRTTEVVG